MATRDGNKVLHLMGEVEEFFSFVLQDLNTGNRKFTCCTLFSNLAILRMKQGSYVQTHGLGVAQALVVGVAHEI